MISLGIISSRNVKCCTFFDVIASKKRSERRSGVRLSFYEYVRIMHAFTILSILEFDPILFLFLLTMGLSMNRIEKSHSKQMN